MISGNQTWQQDLAAGRKQPIYAFEVPNFGIVLASTAAAISAATPVTPTVKQYYPGDFYGDLHRTLFWLLGRQAGAIGNWLGNATLTAGAVGQQLMECGLDLLSGFGAASQAVVENLILHPAPGVTFDSSPGPDGFPINYAPGGPLFVNVFENGTAQKVTGAALNLNPAYSIAVAEPSSAYRVDVYSRTDQFYYQGSAWLSVNPDGSATWTLPYGGAWVPTTACPLYEQVVDSNNNVHRVITAGTSGSSEPTWRATIGGNTTDGSVTWMNMGPNLANAGTVIAALYVGGAPPTLGYAASTIPAGWVAHTNMGVGNRLSNYFARLYVKTDVEYLQEDNVPIIVQDDKHSRCGSSVVPGPGTPTVHILYNDPVVGPIVIFTSLQLTEAYQNLVRSFTIPTSDPLFVPDVTKTSAPALQNRGMTYDQALAIIAFCAAGNYQAAQKIIKQLNSFLDNPGYLATHVFENAEDGAISRWSKSNSSATIANVAANSMANQEPPYGTGQVIKFTSAASGDYFTYVGGGFPDSSDTMISFEHHEPSPVSAVATIAASPIGAVRSSGTTTITTTVAHGFSAGQTVVIAGVGDTSFNGDFVIAGVSSTTFTYAQTGMNNATSGGGSATVIPNNFLFDIGVTSSAGKVTSVQLNGNPAAVAYLSGTTIIVPIGPGTSDWRTTLLDLADLVSSLTNDTLSSITGFKVTLNFAGTLYLDNLSVGGLQPANSLSFSYDIYYGQIDQAYIRAGTMAWVCYAYALYMQLSKDYTPALYLQRMINFIETLKSSASDLTNSLYYLGYGKYQDPGYQFIPGLIQTVATEHQIDIYFAWQRASQVLPTAATELQKAGLISGAQATSLNTTATTCASEATTIVGKMSSNLYIAPGSLPGHFAQGVTGNTLDTSQALDASGSWAAIFCHVAGDDIKALQCLEFAYQQFLVSNAQILLSSAAGSYNKAYQQLTSFSGMKPHNDSAGGYSGSPLSVWPEGTWGMILALLDLYNVSGVGSYFTDLGTGIDSVLKTLISGQVTVKSTTGGTEDAGALLGYSLAGRALPWEFEVWPMFAPTAWWYIVAMAPSFIFTTASAIPQTVLPYLFIPPGSGQTVDELNGTSSIGTLRVESIDPGGAVKNLIAQGNLIGQVCQLAVGFPGQNLSDLVTVETRQISATGWDTDGRITIDAEDVQRFIMGAQAFLNGGPSAWLPGQQAPPQPVGANWVLPNAYPIGTDNPRYVQGNPLDIYLVVMQNELGVGQDPLLPPSAWQMYIPDQPSTLINPNPYIDVPTVLGLRDGPFSGDWFEFKITSAQEGKQWLEDQILKPLGLYHIARANGTLVLKPMKSTGLGANGVGVAPVLAFTDKNIIGLPEIERLPVINYLTIRFNVDYEQGESTAVQKWEAEVTYQQATSIAKYKQYYKHQIEAAGLRIERGGLLRGFLIADRVFRRHAFATPKYKVKTHLSTLVVEVGDFVYLTHRLLPDLQTGRVGINGVVCEVIDRKPNYAQGYMEFELLDTRFMSLTQPYQIAPLASSIPTWHFATPAQRAQYMFVSLATPKGENPDGTPGHAVF